MTNSYLKPGNLFTPFNKNFLKIKSAYQHYLVDEYNLNFTDLSSGLWNVSLGYSVLNNEISASLNKYLDKGLYYLDTRFYEHKLFDEYSYQLIDFVNRDIYNFNKVLITSSGSEANELTLKILNQIASEKDEIIVFSQSYHGNFFGSLSLSGIKRNVLKDSKLQFKLKKINYLDFPQNESDLKKLIQFIEIHPIKAFYIEPVLSSRASLSMPVEYWNQILKACKNNRVITIFDEVATGFYKTGNRFYFHALEHQPDILILSKSINNGLLPFSTTILSKQIYNLIQFKFNDHFSTQNGNLLSVVTAYETLKFFNKNNIELEKNVSRIEKLYRETNFVFNCNFIGSLLSIEINNEYLTELITEKLEKDKILVNKYYFIENDISYSGISIRPPINIDIKHLELSLNRINYILCEFSHLR